MKKIRNLLLPLILVLMLLLAAGCGKKPAPEPTTQAPQTTQEVQVTTQAETTRAPETTQAVETTKAPETTQAESETPQETTPEETEPETEAGPRYYTLADLEDLENTENFSKTAIEHIFNGTVNSQGKGSGYHYDMIEDSDGYIVGERSEEDINGLYTAYVEVNGHKKSHYSTFFPDAWSPQEVVDAINEAREDALKNNRHKGDTWIGYVGDIEINMYFDSKDRVVTAYPIYEDDKR